MEEDVTKDLAEFSIANAVYTALVEGHASEISSRCVHIHDSNLEWESWLLITSNLF